MRGLFASINASVGAPLASKALSAAFKDVWPAFNASVRDALEAERKALRSKYDVFLLSRWPHLRTIASTSRFAPMY